MSDNTGNPEDADRAARADEVALVGFEERCPDCAVAVGEPHVEGIYDGCDVARCLVTGLQRLGCEADHDCGRDLWTGWWPGQVDCERLGWMLGAGFPDLNRLYAEATWNSERLSWMTSP